MKALRIFVSKLGLLSQYCTCIAPIKRKFTGLKLSKARQASAVQMRQEGLNLTAYRPTGLGFRRAEAANIQKVKKS